MSAHDRWLAHYNTSLVTMWCLNPSCDNHTEPVTVRYEEEYGQGWTTPEDCPSCHADLTFDKPEIEEED